MQTSTSMKEQRSGGDLKKMILLSAFFLMAMFTVLAQDTLLITGVVLNENDQPVPNVSVGVEGSMIMPVVTNDSGTFVLKAVTGNCWLNISPSGNYKTRRIFLNNRRRLRIFLTSNDMESEDDPVNVLSMNMLRRNMVASFSFVNMGNIRETPVLSVDQYFQGRVPGMHVTNRSGDPGTGTISYIRGIHTLNSTNGPMYIVDGIPMIFRGVFKSNLDGYEYNPLLGVNPLDISSVTVVKDPTITAAYGSKASNGVIFI